MDQNALKPHRARRSYTDQFKAEMVAECLRGNVSVASLALEQGMNANVLRRWIVEHERYSKHVLQDEHVGSVRPTVDMAPANWIPFTPLQVADDCKTAPVRPVVPAPGSEGVNNTIELELANQGLTMKVRWPASEHKALVQWTRELFT